MSKVSLAAKGAMSSLMFLMATNSFAQEQSSNSQDNNVKLQVPEDFKGTYKDELMSGGPLTRSTGVSNGTQDRKGEGFTPDFQISSPDGSTIVGTASISKSEKIEPTAKKVGDQVHYTYGRRNFSAKLTVPFNDTDDNPFINFKNIGNDAELEFDFSAYVISGKAGTASDRLDVIVTNDCIRKFYRDRQTTGGRVVQELEFALSDDRLQKAAGLIWTHLDQAFSQNKDTLKEVKRACEVGKDNRFKNFERLTDGVSGSVTYYGVSGRAGLEQYSLFNQTAFELSNENRVGFELEGYVGKISANGDKAIRLSGSFARTFDADDPMEQCQTGMTGMQDCLTGLLRAPEQKDRFFASLEGRLILGRNNNGEPTMAIAPQFTYDTEDNEFLVEVPLYLQRNKSSGLDAGIAFNYSSERDDFAIGFFVGVPLEKLF